VRTIDIALRRPHQGQKRIDQDAKRFNCVVCGRRFGKTDFIAATNNALILPAVFQAWKIGVFVERFKDFSQTWNEIVSVYGQLIKAKNETEKFIQFITGGSVQVFSIGDEGRKDEGRGKKYNRVIYEETQKIPDSVLQYHWQSVARPTLTDYKGDAWFIGTPNGKDNYWYQLCQRGAKYGGATTDYLGTEDLPQSDKPSEEWATFRMITTTNPHIDPSEVESAKNDLDSLTFDQEYMCCFVDYTGSPWVYVLKDSDLQKQVFTQSRPLKWGSEQMYLSFDFNKIPMTAAVMVLDPQTAKDQDRSRYKFAPKIVKEFKVGSIEQGEASIYDTCAAIREWIFAETGKKVGKWGEKQVFPFVFPMLVTGDASGNRSDGRQKVPLTYYEIIQEELSLRLEQFVIPKSNPLHAESYVQANTIISKCPNFQIWEDKCPNLRKDCLRIKSNNNRQILKGKGEERQADLLDNLRYLLNTFCKDIKI
jgi:hypothetical protein